MFGTLDPIYLIRDDFHPAGAKNAQNPCIVSCSVQQGQRVVKWIRDDGVHRIFEAPIGVQADRRSKSAFFATGCKSTTFTTSLDEEDSSGMDQDSRRLAEGEWWAPGALLMFQSTATESFESWDNFLRAYYEPIRTAFRLIPYLGENQADDLAQSFFMKMYKQDILEKRPAIKGRFRNWLYVAARRHGVDEWRKLNRRHEQSAAPGDPEPVDPGVGGPDDAPFDADLFYALSILHMTVARVRKHLMEDGKSEHWMIFEELVLAPLIPGRMPKSRDALLAMFPGQPPGFLDNRLTTVKRVFRRILPGARAR